jgi:hypothetical protein
MRSTKSTKKHVKVIRILTSHFDVNLAKGHFKATQHHHVHDSTDLTNQYNMNTRSRERKKRLSESISSSSNGDITPSSSPTKSATSIPDGTTRHINGKKQGEETSAAPPKRQAAIYRVPINTWNFFVRKWEVPRKTLHVSIGILPLTKLMKASYVCIFINWDMSRDILRRRWSIFSFLPFSGM